MAHEQERANALFDRSSFLFFRQSPEQFQFGLELSHWTIQSTCLGIKLIPPGLHIITLRYVQKGDPPDQCDKVLFCVR